MSKKWTDLLKPLTFDGGVTITEPLEYKGEIEPKYLEKVTMTVGDLHNFYEAAIRTAWDAARMNCENRSVVYGYRTCDVFFNSSDSHDYLNALIEQYRK